MLLYNVAVVAVLVLAWTGLGPVGIGFWPVVLTHAGVAVWCVAGLSMPRRETVIDEISRSNSTSEVI